MSNPKKKEEAKTNVPRTMKALRAYYHASQMTLEFAARQVDDLHERCENYVKMIDGMHGVQCSIHNGQLAQLHYVLNYIRLPLKIDPAIKNADTANMLPALNKALKRLGAL